MGEGYCPVPVHLKGIHILADCSDEAPMLEVLRGFDRIQRLLERPQYLTGQKTRSDLLRLAGSIAQQTKMVRVRRRRSADSIESLVAFLESSWPEYFASDTSKQGK
jgi:hypothetical protein